MTLMMMVSTTAGVLVVFLLSVMTSSEATLCSSVTCTEAVCTSYSNECASAFRAGGNCSQACKDAYDQLLRNAVGSQYFGCDCGNDSLCNQSSQNFYNNCFNGVRPSPPPVSTQKPTPCTYSGVSTLCGQNSTCRPLLLAYTNECRFAFQGINCSQQCKQAMDAVFQHPIGRRFTDPICSCAENDTDCVQSGQNLVRACFSTPNYNCTTSDVVNACTKDETCQPRLSAYVTACSSAFQGVSCSQECQRGFVHLLQHRVGNNFSVCLCATQDTACQSAAQNLGTTCFNGTFPTVQIQLEEPASTPTPTVKATAAYVTGNVQLILLSIVMGLLLLISQ